jgi:7-carboxy-7-deazaguanine synthase
MFIHTDDNPFPVFGSVTVVCSPKTPVVCPAIRPHIFHYKYVLEAGKVDDDGLPSSVLGNNLRPYRPEDIGPHRTIWVQPSDQKDPVLNEANMRAAVDSCLKFGYRLTLQTHKYANLE